MKKKLIKAIAVAVVLLMLIPFPLRYKDGGTVKYKAVLYSVTKYHAIMILESVPDNPEGTYLQGISVRILGIEVFNNVK